jgi:hypothetical protein
MNSVTYVRSLLAVILGLALTHLLRGIASLIQDPKTLKPYWVHLTWVLFLFLYLLHFWWWEFHLDQVQAWTFPLYFFVVFYATIAYLLCAILVSDHLHGYEDYRSYFDARRAWFFSLLAVLLALDVVDSLIKGSDYWHRLGYPYVVREAILLPFSLLAMRLKSSLFQSIFAVSAVLIEIAFILYYFRVIG